jgi:hypothetical protein
MPAIVSNPRALVVGDGANQRTPKTLPLVTPPGTTFALVLDGGAPWAPFALLACPYGVRRIRVAPRGGPKRAFELW